MWLVAQDRRGRGMCPPSLAASRGITIFELYPYTPSFARSRPTSSRSMDQVGTAIVLIPWCSHPAAHIPNHLLPSPELDAATTSDVATDVRLPP